MRLGRLSVGRLDLGAYTTSSIIFSSQATSSIPSNPMKAFSEQEGERNPGRQQGQVSTTDSSSMLTGHQTLRILKYPQAAVPQGSN